MAQTPKKRKLPKNIAEKSDSEVADKVFGKQAKKQLDNLAKSSIKEG